MLLKRGYLQGNIHMRLVLCRYATGSAVTGPDALIQDFYASECTNAVR